MGYRSDVAAVFYGPPEKLAALRMKWLHTETFDIWATTDDGFGELLTEWEHEGVAYLLLVDEDTKWYEEYASVAAWSRLEALAEDLGGLNYEFVRIGEGTDDIEEHNWGDEVTGYLGVSRSLSIDLPGQPIEEPAP